MSVKCGYCKRIVTIDHVRNASCKAGRRGQSGRQGGVSDRAGDLPTGQDDKSYIRGIAYRLEGEPLYLDGVDLRSRLDDDEDWDQWY